MASWRCSADFSNTGLVPTAKHLVISKEHFFFSGESLLTTILKNQLGIYTLSLTYYQNQYLEDKCPQNLQAILPSVGRNLEIMLPDESFQDSVPN